MALDPLDDIDPVADSDATISAGLENRTAALEAGLDDLEKRTTNPAPPPADPVPPADTLPGLNTEVAPTPEPITKANQELSDIAAGALIKGSTNLGDFTETPVADRLRINPASQVQDQGRSPYVDPAIYSFLPSRDVAAQKGAELGETPEAPANSWKEISASPKFEQLSPADKLTVAKNYASHIQDFQSSQEGSDANKVEARLNQWVQDRHNEYFPAPAPESLGFVKTFRKEFGQHLLESFAGVAESSAQQQEHPGWVQGIVNSVIDKIPGAAGARQDNTELLHNAAKEYLDQAKSDASAVGFKPGMQENQVAKFAEPLFELLTLSRAGLPTFMAQHRFEAYGQTFNQTGDAGKATRAANLATAGDLLFVGQGHAVVEGLETVLKEQGVAGIKAWAIKASTATAGNVATNQLIRAGDAAANAPEGKRKQAFIDALQETNLSDAALQTGFGLLAAGSPFNRARAVNDAHEERTQDLKKADEFEKDGMVQSAQAQRDLAQNVFNDKLSKLDEVASTPKNGAEPESVANNGEVKPVVTEPKPEPEKNGELPNGVAVPENLRYEGVMEAGAKKLHLFTDTDTESPSFGTTLSVRDEELSTEGIQKKLAQAQVRFGGKPANVEAPKAEAVPATENANGDEISPSKDNLSKWHEKFAARQAANGDANGAPAVEKAVAPRPAGNTVEELAHNAKTDLNKYLKLPEGASSLRVTDSRGRVTLLSAEDLKGANVLHEAGPFKKIEAGTIGKGKNFLPIKEPVTLKAEGPKSAALEAADLRFSTAHAAHEGATTEALHEILGDRVPADLADQVGKRYATVNKIIDSRVPAGKRQSAREAMFDQIRDDMLANAEHSGDPFKTKSGADYSVQSRLLGSDNAAFKAGKLDYFLDKRANQEASNTIDADREEEAAAQVPEPSVPERTAKTDAENRLEQFNNKVAETFSDFAKNKDNFAGLTKKPASTDQVIKAAKIVLDDIGYGETGHEFGFGDKRAMSSRAMAGSSVADLVTNESFYDAVRTQIYDKLSEHVRGTLDKGAVASANLEETESAAIKRASSQIAEGIPLPSVISSMPETIRKRVRTVANDLNVNHGVNGVLERISREPANDPRAALDQKLASTLRNVGDNAKIVLDPTLSSRENALGMFDPNTGKILIDPLANNIRRTIIHEKIHEVTYGKVDAYTKGEFGRLSDDDYQTLRALDTLHKFLLSHERTPEALREAASSDTVKNRFDAFMASDAALPEHYGLLDLHEMVTESLNGEAFQKFLNSIDLPADVKGQIESLAPKSGTFKNAWEAVKALLRRLTFGALRFNENSALAKAFDLSVDLTKTDTLHEQERETRENDPNLRSPDFDVARYEKAKERQFVENFAAEKGYTSAEGMRASQPELFKEAQQHYAESSGQQPFGPRSPAFREDQERQTKFLDKFAQQHRFENATDMALKDPHLFNEAAELYRRPEPTSTDALRSAAKDPSVQDETAKRAEEMFARIDLARGKTTGTEELVRDAMQNGASSPEDFAKAFETDGAPPELARAIGELVDSHFKLAAADKAGEHAQAQTQVDQAKAVVANEGASAENISKLEDAKTEAPPVADPSEPGAQALNLLPHYIDINSSLGKHWADTRGFFKTLKPKNWWAAWRNAADTKANVFARQKANDIRGALRGAMGRRLGDGKKLHDLDAQALSFVVEARNNPESLKAFRDQITDAMAANLDRPLGWKKAANDALAAINHADRNFSRLAEVADAYKKATGDQLALEHLNGFNTPVRDGYVPHRQELEDIGALFGANTSDGGTGFRKMRSHDTFADSIAAGVVPKSMNSVDLLENRVKGGLKAINLQQWAQTGRSLVDPTSNQPVVADPVVETHPVTGNSQTRAPRGYQLKQMGFQSIAVHDGYSGFYDSLTQSSAVRNSPVGRAFLAGEGLVKHGLLLFDSFHLGRLAYYQAFLRGGVGFKKGLLTLDYSEPELRNMETRGELPDGVKADDLIKRKADLNGLMEQGFNLGGIADNMNSHILDSVPVLRSTISPFNKFVFEKYQRGGMATSGLIELERQRRAFPELSEIEVQRKVARELNTRFGNLQKEGWLKSATMRDLAQLTFLAPGWNEGLLRSELGTYKELPGFAYNAAVNRRLQSGALLKSSGTALVGTFVFNQLINYITRGHPTWQNPEDGVGAKLSAWIPDLVGNGPGYFLNPFTLPAELTDQVMEVIDKGATPLEALAQVGGYKISPVARAAATLALRHDRFGHGLNNDLQVLAEAGKTVAPIPISLGSLASAAVSSAQQGKVTEPYKGAVEKQAFASAGIKLHSAPSDVSQTYTRAKAFNKQNGVTPDPNYSTSAYSNLTQAINTNDAKRAQEEFSRLSKNHTQKQIDKHYIRQAHFPFTGSKTREKSFFNSLSATDQDTYRKAVQTRVQLRKDYFSLGLKAPRPTK